MKMPRWEDDKTLKEIAKDIRLVFTYPWEYNFR